MAPTTEEAWEQIQASAPDKPWHSLSHCISHQAEVWMNLLSTGIMDVIQPAAFKLAIVLRHTPPDTTVTLLAHMLRLHPQSQDLTSYILALLTDDEASCGTCSPDGSDEQEEGVCVVARGAAARDLQLFGDCELSVLAAAPDRYRDHADRVKREYSLPEEQYLRLRIQVLKQLSRIPRIYHTPEFAHLEAVARENIRGEVAELSARLSAAAAAAAAR